MKITFIREEVRLLIDNIVNYHRNWNQLDNYLINEKTKAKIWTPNGVLFIDFHPNIKAFNLFEKKAIHSAIRQCNILNAIKNSIGD